LPSGFVATGSTTAIDGHLDIAVLIIVIGSERWHCGKHSLAQVPQPVSSHAARPAIAEVGASEVGTCRPYGTDLGRLARKAMGRAREARERGDGELRDSRAAVNATALLAAIAASAFASAATASTISRSSSSRGFISRIRKVLGERSDERDPCLLADASDLGSH